MTCYRRRSWTIKCKLGYSVVYCKIYVKVGVIRILPYIRGFVFARSIHASPCSLGYVGISQSKGFPSLKCS